MGFTNAQGRYELNYLRDIKGATIGLHTVRISSAPPREGLPPVVPIPPRYNRETELTAEVVSGANIFDWALTSQD